LLAEHPKRLGHRVFRSPNGGGKITDADTRGAVEAEEELEAVGSDNKSNRCVHPEMSTSASADDARRTTVGPSDSATHQM